MLLLETVGLTVGLSEGVAPLVSELNISVESGASVMVVGQSGSGKSLSLKAITGLLPVGLFQVSGRVVFDGEDLANRMPPGQAGAKPPEIGMIFQDPAVHLNPLMTIGQHITELFTQFPTEYGGCDHHQAALDLLGKVRLHEPERIAGSYPHQLSGGQKQRAMIALALATSPKLLVADEPTSALDATIQREIMDLLMELQREIGMALLMVTHDMGLALSLADRIYVMGGGRIVDEFDPKVIDLSRAAPETRRLLQRESETGLPERRCVREHPIISVDQLSKSFGKSGRSALEPTSFDLARGSILAVVGESGSGKTTLGRLLVGLISPTTGTFSLDGETQRSGTRPRTIQMVFQDPMMSLDNDRLVLSLLLETMKANDIGHSVEERKRRAANLLRLVGLSEAVLAAYPAELSGGERQRISIARALCAEPKILVCDESVSALDVHIQDEVIALLAKLRSEMDLTIIFITHDIRLARIFSDEIIVLKDGRVVQSGSSAEVLDYPADDYTRALIAAQYAVPAAM